ncbi:MAG: DUF4384 domain-containing protein, partial [Desulfobacteraceae bacterium]|nr:DUF4384 domain-containing protein [Desulfobacteraceae bacterium]
MVAQLIIGTRDIKPRLMKLDKDRRILAVFDACFSELTVRSTGSFPRGRAEQAGKPKIVPLEDLTGEEMPGIYGTDTLKQPRYPYRNVIYMAASGRRQYALDIGQKDSKMTIDGNPHGAMTDAMLRAFSGQGDTNNDKTITYEELYQYIKVRVSEKFSQSPQRLFPKDNTAMLDQPVFKGVKINKKLPSLPVLNNTLRIRTRGLPPGLEKKIAGIQGITIADKDYDILLTAKTMAGSETETKIYMYLPNDSLIAAVSPKKAVDLIRGQMRVRELILSSYPGQSFNVFADINNYNGVLKEGETVGFTIRVEEDSYILLMNIEPDGFINILYPCEPHELAVVKAGQQLSLDGQNEVKGPNFGTEYIKVFAFRTQPGNMKYIMNGEFDPTDPLFRRLMKMVRNPEIEAAQMTMQVTTCAK